MFFLQACFNEFAPEEEELIPHFMASGSFRDKFAEKIVPKFGVNSQVISVRLGRDGVWPAA